MNDIIKLMDLKECKAAAKLLKIKNFKNKSDFFTKLDKHQNQNKITAYFKPLQNGQVKSSTDKQLKL